MSHQDLLANVKIASPCRARWEDMSGDERTRFCQRCNKHVYNFSAMRTEEVADLVRAKEGTLCGRFYRRKDGTMLTANCPVGLERYTTRVKMMVGIAVGTFLTSLGLIASNRGPDTTERGPFAEKCESMLWTMKGWLGLNPQPAMLGSICPVPTNTPSPSTNAPAPPGVTPPEQGNFR